MERRKPTPIENSLKNLYDAVELVEIVEFMENPQSVNKYSEVITKLRKDHEELITRHHLPLSLDFYEKELKAQEFMLMIFSSKQKTEGWSFGEVLEVAKFFDGPTSEDLKTGFWNLLDKGMLTWTLDRNVKVAENVKA